MTAHGYPRATIDIDLRVEPARDNAEAVLRALRRFCTPVHDLKVDDLQQADTWSFRLELLPRRIDIITGASGLRFEESYGHSTRIEGLQVRIPSLEEI